VIAEHLSSLTCLRPGLGQVSRVFKIACTVTVLIKLLYMIRNIDIGIGEDLVDEVGNIH